jgi:hypothetical protein
MIKVGILRSVDCTFFQSCNAVGPIAQSVEQRTFNPWVDGSSPSGPTLDLTFASNCSMKPIIVSTNLAAQISNLVLLGKMKVSSKAPYDKSNLVFLLNKQIHWRFL